MARTRIAAAAALMALAAAVPAVAHQGNPNFLSRVTSTPDGLRVEVLNRDDRLLVRNETGRTVVLEGYEQDPYARLLPDGAVQLNQRSTATYLNDERFGQVDVPAKADRDAAPEWKLLDRSGRFEFHDHRMHYMVEGGVPPQVRDRDVRQKVYDWSIPVTVGGKPAAIRGELLWTPAAAADGGGAPTGAIVALAGLALAGAATVVVVRRRRGRDGAQPGEAW